MADDLKHLFISYAPKDSQFALRLYDLLAGMRFNVWIDSRDIGAGSSWDEMIRKALDNSSHLILINSTYWGITPYTKEDASYALKKGISIIGILLDKSPLSLRWREIPAVNFYGRDFDEAFTEFVSLLKENLPDNVIIPQPVNAKPTLSIAPSIQTHEERLLAEYLTFLNDSDKETERANIVQQLGELKTHNNALLEMLKDPSPIVRREAVLALARVGSVSSKVPLQKVAIEDQVLEVRLFALMALMFYESRDDIPIWLNNLAQASTAVELNEAISSAQLRVKDLIKNPPQHVFISYTRRDAEHFTVELADNLRELGFPVWIDTKLEPGTPVWVHEIEKAIQQAGVCIVILSPAIHDSEWVPKEVHFAQQFRKPIIPIKYLETHKPLYLATEQGLRDDFPFAEHYSRMFELLISALDKILKRVR